MNSDILYLENADYSDFLVDLSFLKIERPVGVTGLLRVKNDAEFIELCISSCIDALDELIVTYQKSDDNAPEVIEKMRKKYPHKIKVYFYKPSILSHNLSKEELDFVKTMPENSVHLLSNYYNYSLSKVSYKYVVKIDTDQVYFSEKLKGICDLYRSSYTQKITFKERLVSNIALYLDHCYNVLPLMGSLFFSNVIMGYYESYIKKMIVNKKVMLSVSGVNLFFDKNGWEIPLGNNANGIRSPFNGVGDTLFFEISKDTYYTPWECYDKRRNRYFYLEKFYKKEQTVLQGGFLWFHLDAIRKNKYLDNKSLYNGNIIKVADFLKKKNIVNVNRILFMKSFRFYYSIFFEYEKKKMPWDMLEIIKKHLAFLSVS